MLVFHAKEPSFGITTPKWPEEYQLVAQVNTNNLEEAFMLTNTIDNHWWENFRVKSFVGPCRSTSVGDVVASKGKAWYCDSVGWREIE